MAVQIHKPREATIVVAASDSETPSADYVCDGTADEVEIQAALDDLPAGGGKVLLLEGTYNIADTIRFPAGSVWLVGCGPSTIINNQNVGGEDAIKIGERGVLSHTNPACIKDLKIAGNASSGYGISLYGGCFCYPFSGLVITLHGQAGVFVDSGIGVAFIGCTSSYNGTYGFDLGNPGLGIANQTNLICCNIHHNADGIRITSAAEHCLIFGNLIEVHTNVGVIVDDIAAVIEGNWFETNGGPDIYLNAHRAIVGKNRLISGAHVAIQLTNAALHCVIESNTIEGVGGGTGIQLDAGTYYHIIRPQIWAGALTYIVDNSGHQYNIYTLIDTATTWRDTLVRGCELFQDVLAEVAQQIVAAEDLTQVTPITCTIAGQPDVPRNVKIAITDGDVSITDFDIDVVGVDSKGDAQTENFIFAGGLNQVGNIAFATITSVTVNSITGDGAGDILDVGIGSKIGLSNTLDYTTTDVYKVKKNNADYPAASYTVNTTYNTVDVSTGGAINAGDDFTIWFRSNLNVLT